jgi:hypothetical protein
MHLILMILYVGLSSFSYCVFSLRYVLSNKWCNLYLSLPWISEDCYPVWSSIHISCLHSECCSSPVLSSSYFKWHR